jgi:hypothetical protein
LISRDPIGSLPAATQEWLAAEKLYGIVSNGSVNTRLKDFYDVARLLLPRAALAPKALRGCLERVFEGEFGGRVRWPVSADSAAALGADFASAEQEAFWQSRRWAELEGRPFDPGRDPSLAATCEAVALGLERLGLLAPGRAAAASAALSRLSAAPAGDAGALLSGFAAFFDAVRVVGPRRVAARREAERRAGGGGPRALEALAGAVRAADAAGTLPAVSAAWAAAGRGSLREAVTVLASGMDALAVPAAEAPGRSPVPASEITPERLAVAAQRVAGDDLNAWIVGLSTLAEARAAGLDVSGIEVSPPPGRPGAAQKGWAGVARRHGFDGDLDAVLADLRAAAPPAP